MEKKFILEFSATECFIISDALQQFMGAVKTRKIRPNMPESHKKLKELYNLFFKCAHTKKG